MTRKRVTISTGNSKLGSIPSVSLPPGTSCIAGAPCRRECYANKAMRMFPSARAAWRKNWRLQRDRRDDYFADISEYIETRAPRYFRWHVSGDIPDQDYLQRMFATARAFPETRFLAFTKRHGLDFRGRPKNLVIVLSMWSGGFGNVRKGLPRAWYQDGTETRVPADAVECPGNCEHCGMCWALPTLGRDVVFHKH